MQPTAVLIAYRGETLPHHNAHLLSTLQHELSYPVLRVERHAHIDMARSLLATTALRLPVDVLFFVDDDMKFDVHAVGHLAEVARATRGIVGVPYASRRRGAPLIGAFSPDLEEAGFFESGSLYPAAGVVGTGFLAAHREVFERFDALPEYAERDSADGPLRPYFQKLVVEGYWLREDASFCHTAAQLGLPLHLDTRVRVAHQGSYDYHLEDHAPREPLQASLTLRLRAKP